ncbi:hypothetical protein AB3M83_03710 [Microbacterium sp. 179-B 1A2 NHS]|uniref:hypothetical protein n=1 Tax=Microbacterium sp. 179-B 1A2 NHS TaxID=3142383 RepID=UPI0039A32A78
MTNTPDAANDETTSAGRPGDHYGQDGGSDAISVSDSQSDHAGESTQDRPGMSQNDADASQKIEGVLVQTRADIAGHDDVDGPKMLAERLEQAGISMSSDEFDAVAARLRG